VLIPGEAARQLPDRSHSANLDQRRRPDAYRDSDRLFLTDQDNQLFPSGDAGIQQVALQHGLVLRHNGNYDFWNSEPWLL